MPPGYQARRSSILDILELCPLKFMWNLTSSSRSSNCAKPFWALFEFPAPPRTYSSSCPWNGLISCGMTFCQFSCLPPFGLVRLHCIQAGQQPALYRIPRIWSFLFKFVLLQQLYWHLKPKKWLITFYSLDKIGVFVGIIVSFGLPLFCIQRFVCSNFHG